MAHDEYDPMPWWKRGPIIAAMAVIAVLLLGGGGIMLGSQLTQPQASPSTIPAGESSIGTQSVAEPDASVCGLTARSSENDIETSPPNTKWETVGNGLGVQQDAEHGPGVVESDGFRFCYSRTATGALYSAINAFTVATVPSMNARVAPQLVAAGAGRDALEARAATTSPTPFEGASFKGYRFTAYTDRAATLELALERSAGDLGSVTVDLLWNEGDWKLVATPDGSLMRNPQLLSNLSGFVPWGP